ncbi:hypothetical protein JT359_06860 [Candidatus Poribacteria bacterium]|nr:hypothetical protein [Candidatus Poribacteria bacterium]
MQQNVTLEDKLKQDLDGQQYTIATDPPEKTRFRRVRGPAGSGKSIALAGRAAQLASEGKVVLICNFNITLLGYLKSLVKNFIDPIPPHITFFHFHRWCRHICERTGFMKEYKQLQQDLRHGYFTHDEYFDYKMPELLCSIYDNNSNRCPTYDAILLDEGHDFKPHWWSDVLRKAIRTEGGEALFVCDKTQNIYSTAEAWTDQTMQGLACGFNGPWMELSSSYRLPVGLISILEHFSEEYLSLYGGDINIPSKESDQPNLLDRFRWVQVSPEKSSVDVCVSEIEYLRNEMNINEVHFLSPTDRIGQEVVREIRQRGGEIFSTFNDQEAKLKFRPGCAPIVATTVHSFKGWEASHLIVYIDKIENLKDCAVFYTALSRLKKNDKGAVLTVVSSCPELKQFGSSNFPEFLSIENDNQDLIMSDYTF